MRDSQGVRGADSWQTTPSPALDALKFSSSQSLYAGGLNALGSRGIRHTSMPAKGWGQQQLLYELTNMQLSN